MKPWELRTGVQISSKVVEVREERVRDAPTDDSPGVDLFDSL